jgi:hypothetical protein
MSGKFDSKSRKENSVLFALRELQELEGERHRREEDERRRREEQLRLERAEAERRAAAAEAVRRAAASAAAVARAEAEARVAAELAALRAEVHGAPPDALRAMPSMIPGARRPVHRLVKATMASVSVAALAVVAALLLVPPQTISRPSVHESFGTSRVGLVGAAFVPTAAPADDVVVPATAKPKGPGHGHHTHTAVPVEDCRFSKDPLCGTHDVGSAR